MKNSDMPAMPLALDVRVDEQGNQFCNDAYNGLTKREYFAGLAMQGIMAAGIITNVVDVASDAVTYADELLEALEDKD